MSFPVTFYFKGKPVYYNRISFNNLGERAVEIPIAFEFLANITTQNSGRDFKIMEVGNVLSHYENSLSEYLGLRPRRIVDKFEIAMGVDNVDLMDLPSEQKYDVIVSISTVEHIGQGAEPSSGSYGEKLVERDLETPLKAIAKIYDLLELGGQALITVPFGKLIDAGWFIQFDAKYLELLPSKYQIPETAISFHYFQKLGIELEKNNPLQEWIQLDPQKITQVEFNWPFPFANAIAVIELTKLGESFILRTNQPPTDLQYHSPYPVIQDEYVDLLDPHFLLHLKTLREINLIFIPEWFQSESSLLLELENVIKSILNHPDCPNILLMIDASTVSEEDANLLLAGVTMKLLSEDNIDVTEEAEIILLGNMTKIQQAALLPRIHYRITLNSSPESGKANMFTEKITPCDLKSLSERRTVKLEKGRWDLR